MGSVTYPDGIAIWRLIFFLPALFTSIYVCSRHGFMKSSGWVFLTIFCLIRIIGSCAQLATINDSNDNDTAYTIALVCAVLGLSPLLLSSLGIISRLYYSILKMPLSLFFQLVILKAIQVPAAIGLILCIIGATNTSSPTQISSQSTVHIGIILFLAVYIAICLLTLIAWFSRSKLPGQEPTLLIALVCALPFILVRIIYSLLSAFANDSTFDLGNGSVKSTTVQLFMEVLEEMGVVVLYLAAGVRVKGTPLREGTGAAETIGYRAGRGDFGSGKLGILSLGLGVVNAMRSSGAGERRVRQQQDQQGQGAKVQGV